MIKTKKSQIKNKKQTIIYSPKLIKRKNGIAKELMVIINDIKIALFEPSLKNN